MDGVLDPKISHAFTARADRSGDEADSSALRESFPDLAVVHEFEIRGSLAWQTLSQIALCFARVGADAVSLNARRYAEQTHMTCRTRYLEDGVLNRLVEALRAVPEVSAVLVSHHFGRAAGLAGPDPRGT